MSAEAPSSAPGSHRTRRDGCAFVSDGAFAERTPSGSKIFELEPIEAKRQQLHACVEKAVGEVQTPPQRESPREGSAVASSHRRTSSTPSDRFDDGIDFERIFQGTDSKPALSRTASEASVRPCAADLIVRADAMRSVSVCSLYLTVLLPSYCSFSLAIHSFCRFPPS